MEQSGQVETKAQRAERLKRELNPWEQFDRIREFARSGFDSIPREWGAYFRWWGVYTQGDGLGVLGGKGGEGKSAPFLMVRVKVPGGKLYSHQVRAVADLAERYGRGVCDITVRQNFQFHWVTIESLPELLETLWRHGLTTVGACGDVTRNVTGCPVAGLDAAECFDASPWVQQVSQMLTGDPEFVNLPRKYKISIGGCRSWCNYPEINDIGLTPALDARDEWGFNIRVAGGLSTEPHRAVRLDAFVPRHQVPLVVRGVTQIFRDSDCLRENRERARLKYLFLREGWTGESFLGDLQRRTGLEFAPAGRESVPDEVYRDHVGIHSQQQTGYSYVGASVPVGRITPAQLRAAADLADGHAAGELRATIMQNLLIVNVPTSEAPRVAAGLQTAGLPTGGSPFSRGMIACTGTEYCKLAITETKGFARWLAGELEERLPGYQEHLKVHVTGCPNSCGQHWIADIGLEGKKVKVGGEMRDAYYFFVGGKLGAGAAFARKTGFRCASEEVPAALARLLGAYERERASGETLSGFLGRTDDTHLKALLSGIPAGD